MFKTFFVISVNINIVYNITLPHFKRLVIEVIILLTAALTLIHKIFIDVMFSTCRGSGL